MKEKISNIAYIGLGSNVGDKIFNITTAVKEIILNENCSLEKISSIYETKPYGVKEQENFINSVLKIKTKYDLVELFYFMKSIEKKLGRSKTKKWGPREIDLDILFFNTEIYSDEMINVPHKDIENRDFVLVPLCEIDKDLVHPVLKKKICDMLSDKIEKNIIKKLQVNILN